MSMMMMMMMMTSCGVRSCVCLSVTFTFIYCIEMTKRMLKLFSLSGKPAILVFHTVSQYSDRDPQQGVKRRWSMKKIATFDQYLALSRKWYKIWPQLLWNVNTISYAIYQMVPFWMTWMTSNPSCFKGTTINVEYLRNGTSLRHSYNVILIRTYSFNTTWHYTKPKHGIDELKQRLINTWDSIPQGISDEASGKHGCMNV